MPLTDRKILSAEKSDKAYKLADGAGLYLLVHPNGGKYWRYAYRFAGKQKTLAIGVYPEVKGPRAREMAMAARRKVRAGADPAAERKLEKLTKANSSSNTFEGVALEWLEMVVAKNNAEATLKKAQLILGNHVFRWIGNRPISEIKVPELLAMLRRIESNGTLETAHRARQYCGQVFRYAIQSGRAERDVSRDLKGAIATPDVKHRPAITDPKKLGELIRAIDGFDGTFIVHSAMKLAPMLFVRPGELRKAEWADIDLDAAEWRFFVTKTKTDHIVPLSRQAVAILKELATLQRGRYVFPGARTSERPMSEAAVNAGFRRLGYSSDELTGHGFRATARTIMDEVLGLRVDFIEHQLAHAVKDPNGRAYNRTAHLAERHKMMQTWADYLDEVAAGATVLPFRAGNEA